MARLALYANEHGRASGWPYYSLDGLGPVTAKEWDALRHGWRHAHGLTNVWRLDPLHGEERVKDMPGRAPGLQPEQQVVGGAPQPEAA